MCNKTLWTPNKFVPHTPKKISKEFHMNLLTCGVSQVKKFIWSGSLLGCPKQRNSDEMKWFTFVVWQPGPYFLWKWHFNNKWHGILIKNGLSPWTCFFAPHGARAFFSLGSEFLHTSEDGGVYIYIYYIHYCTNMYQNTWLNHHMNNNRL